MGENDHGGEALLTRLLTNFAGLGAVVVGVLYLSGLLLKWSELRNADVAIDDVMPLYPLEQILGTGLALIAPALAGLLVMAALLGGAHAVERKLVELSASFRTTRAGELPAEQRATWDSSFGSLIEKKAWDDQSAEIKRALEEAEGRGAQDRVKELRAARRWYALFSASAYSFGGILAIAYFTLLPAALAGAMFAVTGIAGAVLGRRERPVRHTIGSFYLLFVLALAISLIAYPRDLPEVQIVTDNEGVVEGSLVLRANSSWYLKTSDGVLRSIADDHAECTRVETSPRRLTTLLESILDDEDPAERRPPLPDLRCKPNTASAD